MLNINEIPKNVYERLEYLEFMLRFRGWVSRADLTERFGLSDAATTRDIRLYKDFAENNLQLNQKTKKYEINEKAFKPLFELGIETALTKIKTTKISEALGMSAFDGILCVPRLSFPKIDYLSIITRAISGKKQLKISYGSVEKGKSEKIIIPHGIFDNGIHWYMRAYDVVKGTYRTYALTRVYSIEIDSVADINTSIEIINSDFQWNRMVKLELVPHPNRKNVSCPETIEHDFNMEGGCLIVNVRATVAGYWLHHWNVDCTEDHSLEGYNYQLWLNNHLTLYDVESRKIAPGLSEYKYTNVKNT